MVGRVDVFKERKETASPVTACWWLQFGVEPYLLINVCGRALYILALVSLGLVGAALPQGWLLC
jgi:hypothetical protein